MRKYGLLMAAAGVALSGSFAKADWTVSTTRTNNGATDTVNFFVFNNGLGDSVTSFGALGSADIAIYAPVTAAVPNNGIFISINTVGPNHGTPNVGSTSTLSSVFTAGGVNPVTTSVLTLGGTVDSPATVRAYTAGQQVAGLGVAISGNNSAFGDASSAASPLQFASIVVPAGGPVELLQNVPGKASVTLATEDGNRSVLTGFEPGGTSFSGDNTTIQTATNVRSAALINGTVPEPASIGLLGIGLAGLVAGRRRRVV